MRLTEREVDLVATLLAGHTWTSAVDLVGISSLEASNLRQRLPLQIDDRGRLTNPRGFARWLIRQAMSAPAPKAPRKPGPSAKHSGLDPAAIRAWARQQGRHCATHGRLPTGLLNAYAAAHPAASPTKENS